MLPAGAALCSCCQLALQLGRSSTKRFVSASLAIPQHPTRGRSQGTLCCRMRYIHVLHKVSRRRTSKYTVLRHQPACSLYSNAFCCSSYPPIMCNAGLSNTNGEVSAEPGYTGHAEEIRHSLGGTSSNHAVMEALDQEVHPSSPATQHNPDSTHAEHHEEIRLQLAVRGMSSVFDILCQPGGSTGIQGRCNMDLQLKWHF